MNTTLKTLVTKCVEKNISFSGAVGSFYTIQDLFHNVGVASINKMWKRTKKELDSLSTDSLYENSSSSKASGLRTQLDTLKEVFEYKQAQIKAANDAEKIRSEAAAKLAVLGKIKTEKELEAMGAMSLEDIEKEIEKYS
jgi:hypothetical protein